MSGNTPKILIVVVVVLVILFVIGIGAGASGGLNISVDSVTGSLGKLFGNGVPLSLDDITASSVDCLNRAQRQIIVPVGSSCTLTAGSLSGPITSVRVLRMRLTNGVSIQYDLGGHPTSDTTLTVENKSMLSQPDPVQIDFYPYPDNATPPSPLLPPSPYLILHDCLGGGQSSCLLELS